MESQQNTKLASVRVRIPRSTDGRQDGVLKVDVYLEVPQGVKAGPDTVYKQIFMVLQKTLKQAHGTGTTVFAARDQSIQPG